MPGQPDAALCFMNPLPHPQGMALFWSAGAERSGDTALACPSKPLPPFAGQSPVDLLATRAGIPQGHRAESQSAAVAGALSAHSIFRGGPRTASSDSIRFMASTHVRFWSAGAERSGDTALACPSKPLPPFAGQSPANSLAARAGIPQGHRAESQSAACRAGACKAEGGPSLALCRRTPYSEAAETRRPAGNGSAFSFVANAAAAQR